MEYSSRKKWWQVKRQKKRLYFGGRAFMDKSICQRAATFIQGQNLIEQSFKAPRDERRGVMNDAPTDSMNFTCFVYKRQLRQP